MEFLGDKFIKSDMTECGREAIDGYKLIMVVYSANWWPACAPFKAELKNFYQNWNLEKKLQVVIVSEDKDQNGFE